MTRSATNAQLGAMQPYEHLPSPSNIISQDCNKVDAILHTRIHGTNIQCSKLCPNTGSARGEVWSGVVEQHGNSNGLISSTRTHTACGQRLAMAAPHSHPISPNFFSPLTTRASSTHPQTQSDIASSFFSISNCSVPYWIVNFFGGWRLLIVFASIQGKKNNKRGTAKRTKETLHTLHGIVVDV